jgi:hypothetical protein
MYTDANFTRKMSRRAHGADYSRVEKDEGCSAGQELPFLPVWTRWFIAVSMKARPWTCLEAVHPNSSRYSRQPDRHINVTELVTTF